MALLAAVPVFVLCRLKSLAYLNTHIRYWWRVKGKAPRHVDCVVLPDILLAGHRVSFLRERVCHPRDLSHVDRLALRTFL
jgi:hypothetical protein